MTNSNRPVYRYPPRSHADNCPCPRCEPFRRPAKGGPVYQHIDRYGLIGPLLLWGGLFALLGFWPAMIWHGQNDMGGWRWDIHSTIGCLIWWGVLLTPLLAAVITDARRKRAPQPAAKAACNWASCRAGGPCTRGCMPGTPASRPCWCNWCQGRAGVHGTEAVALYLREAAAACKTPPASPSLPFTPVSLTCQHPNAVPVELSTGERVAWLCPDPPDGCGAQLGPGERSAELKPHAGWPPVRRVPREDD